MKGKEVAKAVADCMAGKPNSAMLLLGGQSVGLFFGGGIAGKRIPVAESESAFDLVDSCALAEHADILVESTTVAAVDEVRVDEDEGLLKVETNGNDVHGVL